MRWVGLENWVRWKWGVRFSHLHLLMIDICKMKKLSKMNKIIEWVRQVRRISQLHLHHFNYITWLLGVYYFLIRIKRQFVKNLIFLSNIDSLPRYHEIVMQEFDQEISFIINAKMCLFVPLHLYILVVLKCFLLICYKVWNVKKRLFFQN